MQQCLNWKKGEIFEKMSSFLYFSFTFFTYSFSGLSMDILDNKCPFPA